MLSLCLALYGLAVSPVLDPKPLREVLSLPDGLNGHRLTVDVYSGSIVYGTQKEVFRSRVLEDGGLRVHKNPDNDHLVIVGSRDQGLLVDMRTWKVRSRFSARLAAYNSEFGLVKVFGSELEPQRIRVGRSVRTLPKKIGFVLSITPGGDYLLTEVIGTGADSNYSIYSIRKGGELVRVVDFEGPYREGGPGSLVRVSKDRFALEYGLSFNSYGVFTLDLFNGVGKLTVVGHREGQIEHHLQQNRRGAAASLIEGVFPFRSTVLQIEPKRVKNLGYFDSRFGFMVTPKGELFPYVPKERWSDELEPSPGPQTPFTGKERRE